MTFRLRDALRDLARAPGATTIVITAALAIAAVPLLLSALAASRGIAAAGDARTALARFQAWAIVATVLGPIAARAGAALVASAWVARADRSISIGEAAARALAHGIPALVAGGLALALSGLGLIAFLVGALPLAAITFVAAPAAAAEQLAPVAAMRRSAALTRGARVRLGAWSLGALIVPALPFAYARVTMLAGKKPPVAPILHAQQVQAALVIAAAALGALVQVAAYRRLRDARAEIA